MAISDSEKVDLLWKKVAYGVSKTNTGIAKLGSNETVASPLPVYANNIWQKADQIPGVAPVSTTSVVGVFTGAQRIRLTVDPTVAGNFSWLAQSTYGDVSSARLGDFIPPTFGTTYAIKVYIGDPQVKAARIFPDTTSEEFVFDYVAGVLNFIGGLPANKSATIGSGTVSVATDGIYIEIFQYVGGKGVAAAGTTSKNNVVPDIAARNALTGLSTGDTVFVIDASGIPSDAKSGEWAMYMWTGSSYTLISTQDSARTDAFTGSLTVTSATVSQVLGSIGNGARVVEISVQVTTAFDGDFDISIGDSTVPARLLDGNFVDLQTAGTYVVTPAYRFPTASETDLVLTVTGTGTVGEALVAFTYA